MSSQHASHQTVAQAIDGLHPNFVNLRFAAQEIEKGVIMEQKKIRPLTTLLQVMKSQVESRRSHSSAPYASPTP